MAKALSMHHTCMLLFWCILQNLLTPSAVTHGSSELLIECYPGLCQVDHITRCPRAGSGKATRLELAGVACQRFQVRCAWCGRVLQRLLLRVSRRILCQGPPRDNAQGSGHVASHLRGSGSTLT